MITSATIQNQGVWTMNSEKQTRWLWYPGDFEIRQGLLQNFSREERGYDWPAYWNVDDCHKNVKFKRYYELTEPTSFIVYATGIGYVEVNGKKYPLKKQSIVSLERIKSGFL